MTRLSRLTIRGFRSIQSLEDFELKDLTVLIGANASGKSNFFSFLQMLHYSAIGTLQLYVSRNGGSNAMLFGGAETTSKIEGHLHFDWPPGPSEYIFRLVRAAPDSLIFAQEEYTFSVMGGLSTLGAGHREPKIVDAANAGREHAEQIVEFLRDCGVHHLRNTGDNAGLRQRHGIEDSHALREDAANLAPILHLLKKNYPPHYARIVRTIRQIQPEFFDFALEDESSSIYLQWYERTSPYVFGAHQASDGGLRAMALVTLLLLPEKKLPQIILLDEPELGLHPHAINIIAGLIKSVATTRQVVLATQSMTLLDYFDPADIVVVDRQEGASTFRRLDPRALESWLEDYSMAELWEKNVIAGTP